MSIVKIKDNESFESALRRFKKSCERAGILSEIRKREHYEKPSVKRKKKAAAARKRNSKKNRYNYWFIILINNPLFGASSSERTR